VIFEFIFMTAQPLRGDLDQITDECMGEGARISTATGRERRRLATPLPTGRGTDPLRGKQN